MERRIIKKRKPCVFIFKMDFKLRNNFSESVQCELNTADVTYISKKILNILC